MKMYLCTYPGWGEQSPLDLFLTKDDARANLGKYGYISEIEVPIPDGIYAVKDGQMVKIDRYEWGYEGMATAEESVVIDNNGKKDLVIGVFAHNEKVLIDFKS